MAPSGDQQRAQVYLADCRNSADMNASNKTPLVLVVDDDRTMRLLVRETLERCGFAVEEAADGAAGMGSFQRRRPDVVLLDVMMPELDGFGACAALRGLPGGEHVPILMMTGLDDPESIDRAYQAGATDFITKPITWAVLGYRVRYSLRASKAFLDLSQSQARLANAQRIAQIGHWDWDIANDQLLRSDEVYRILARTPDQLPHSYQGFLEVVHPDDRESVEDSMQAVVHHREPCNIDFRVVRPDGSIRIAHAQAEVTLDQSGKPALLQGTLQDVTERKRAEEQIRHLALYDSLTGLPNRQFFKEQLTHAIAQSERNGQPLAMISLDLDRFKRINDTLGHPMGDLLLKEAGNRLTRSLRPTDRIARNGTGAVGHCVARPGGDEFSMLLTGLKQPQDAGKIASRIIDLFNSQPFCLDGKEVVISASVGIAVYPIDGTDADSLHKNADAAMYYAKERGKNNYQYYNGKMNTSALEKLTLESRLRKALEREEFVLYYQPKVEIISGAIVGAEALIRWRHPELGMVSPMDFIPLAEETGLIIPIGEWVLRTACAQIRKWHDAGFTWMQVAVNMSSPNLAQEGFDKVIEQALGASGLDPRCLELEMTESMLMQHAETTIDMLNRLKATGIKLSMDDFGTGYSSLSYLRRFPLDTLKIDRSFVREITERADDAAITSAILAMAESLKLTVVAEGVETESQAALLRRQGCRYVQGYLFGKPVAADEFLALLQTMRPRLAVAG